MRVCLQVSDAVLKRVDSRVEGAISQGSIWHTSTCIAIHPNKKFDYVDIFYVYNIRRIELSEQILRVNMLGVTNAPVLEATA